ncbi:MAG: hypothetical protein KA100_05025 [Rickettsiales bacterium]|nr:hypothetical protein [Rickettsiales bacterium]
MPPKKKSKSSSAPAAAPSPAPVSNGYIFEFEGRKIIPVETCAFNTVDFRANPNAILFSGNLTQCPTVVIRKDHVATMAHFFPNNAYDERTAKANLELAIADFKAANGGEMPKGTSFQVFGGGAHSPAELGDSARAILIDTMKEKMRLDLKPYKNFKADESSITYMPTNPNIKESTAVFVDSSGTAVTRKILNTSRTDMEVYPLSELPPSMPIELLAALSAGIHSNQLYERFVEQRANKIADAADRGPMTIEHMRAVTSDLCDRKLSAERLAGDLRALTL